MDNTLESEVFYERKSGHEMRKSVLMTRKGRVLINLTYIFKIFVKFRSSMHILILHFLSEITRVAPDFALCTVSLTYLKCIIYII